MFYSFGLHLGKLLFVLSLLDFFLDLLSLDGLAHLYFGFVLLDGFAALLLLFLFGRL